MSKPFKKLLDKIPEKRRKRIELKTRLLQNEIALQELREALDLTQEELARSLNIKKTAISDYEHQSDLYLRTLRKILFTMGADLKLVAHFPEGEVLINQFSEIRREV